MFFSSIIEFCIGMSFFYLILTLISTMINEFFMDKVGKLRQQNLLDGISGLFYDAQKVFDLYNHPLIRGLYQDEQILKTPGTMVSKPGEDSLERCREPFKDILKNLPSYIPSRTFVTALLDTLAPAKNANVPLTFLVLRNTVKNAPNARIQEALLPLIDSAKDDLAKARQNIEKWFDDSMDRISGWFKRQARWWLIWVALPVCIVLNADSIMVGKMLWQNDALRAAVVAQAEKKAKEPSGVPGPQQASKPGLTKKPQPQEKQQASGPEQTAGAMSQQPAQTTPATKDIQKEIRQDIDMLQLPVGWVLPSQREDKASVLIDPRAVPTDPESIFFKIMGLFFTTLAISLGAPFWTDLLNSFVNLRRCGNVPLKAGEKGK
jgi:hypothetical protein